MKKSKKDEFFELLCLNSKDELNNWLINNGKSQKAICPVCFEKNEEDKFDE